MPNPNFLPQGPVSFGGTTGPIEQMFQYFLETAEVPVHGNEMREIYKRIFYIAAMQVYNTMLSAMRADSELNVMVMVTNAMRIDLNQYFGVEENYVN